MTSFQILGSNEEHHHAISSFEGHEKLQPSSSSSKLKYYSPKRRFPNNNKKRDKQKETRCTREDFMASSLAHAVAMDYYFSDGSISSLEASLSYDDECDDNEVITATLSYTSIEDEDEYNKHNTNKKLLGRWESELSQDSLPSSPRRRSFEIKRTGMADRLLTMEPRRRASCDTGPVVPLRRWGSVLSDCSELSN
jgi:hypothetical protein